MTIREGARLSVSTWSLHRALGRTWPDAPGEENSRSLREGTPAYGPGTVSLLDIPARVAALGIETLEVCHFHLPSREATYLADLRGALDASNSELWSLLIDAGDITHPTHHARDVAWVCGWVETAGALGARCVRVIAGKQAPSDASNRLSRAGLSEIVAVANSHNVRVLTENWFAFLPVPDSVLLLLDEFGGDLDLCLDFGNWDDRPGRDKYADLAAIAPRAASCHTKARFPAPGVLDREDYVRCLELTREAGFAGPYTLIYDGPGDDEWAALVQERDVVLPYVAA